MPGVNNRHGLHFSAIAYQNSIWKLRPAYLRQPITREEKKEKKKNQSTSILPAQSLLRQIPSAHPAAKQLQLGLHQLQCITPPALTSTHQAELHRSCHECCPNVGVDGNISSRCCDNFTESSGGIFLYLYFLKKYESLKATWRAWTPPHPPTVGPRSPCGLLGHVTERLTPAWRVTGGWLWHWCHFSPVSRDNFCSFCCLTSAWPPPMSSSHQMLDKCRVAVGGAAIYSVQDHVQACKNSA